MDTELPTGESSSSADAPIYPLLIIHHSEWRADCHLLAAKHRNESDPPGKGRFDPTTITCSSIADATSQVLILGDPEDPQLSRYHIDHNEFAVLYSMYWEKTEEHLKECEPVLPFPKHIVPGDELYVFSQYTYIIERIDAFRKLHEEKKERPPGLALIGTPGIGELITIHLFI